MTEFFKFIFTTAAGFLGERAFAWLCKALNKNNIQWHVRTLLKLCFRKLPISLFISVSTFYIWLFYKGKVNELVMKHFEWWFMPFPYLILACQTFFFFGITLFFLVLKEYLYELEKKQKITETFKQLVAGNQLKDAISDLSGKVYISECVLSDMINRIPGAVILVDRLFNLVLCNNDYREFCRENFLTVNLGKSIFYTFHGFLPDFRFQTHIFNTFNNAVKSEDVLIIFKEIEFNTGFYPIKNGEVLMVMVILRKTDAT